MSDLMPTVPTDGGAAKLLDTADRIAAHTAALETALAEIRVLVESIDDHSPHLPVHVRDRLRVILGGIHT